MDALVVIGGLTALYLIIALAITRRDHDSASKWFETAQTICAVGAFGLAAFWYFVERKAQPHADVTQELHAVQVSPGLAAVEVHVSLKNLGSQLLTLKHARITLQLARPGAYDYEALWAKKGQDYWSALKSKPGEPDNPYFDEAELRWFPVREYDGEIYHRIEPEETDLLVATFLVKCTAKVVRVATAIERRTDWLNRDKMTWTARSFLDLGETCVPEEPANPKDQTRPAKGKQK